MSSMLRFGAGVLVVWGALAGTEWCATEGWVRVANSLPPTPEVVGTAVRWVMVVCGLFG